MLRMAFLRQYQNADAMNRRNILELMQDRTYSTLCDLGCDDGEWTLQIARSIGARQSFGVEVEAKQARLASARGVLVAVSDLAAAFPFADESFELVHANQVIEHVVDVDHFLAETNRILRVGGTAVISTENGSSWHNIFAATMGWQIFSLTNVSGLSRSVGNPMALHSGEPVVPTSWTHKTIFNYRGLIELIRVHGLEVVEVKGAGYYPLPASVGRLDVRHSHFIAVKAVKTAPTARGASA